MDFNSAISSYNKKLQALIGESIRFISYCEIDFEEPLFDCGAHHSVDHGVQFKMESGKQFYIIWSEQYQSHDLKFETGSILSQFPEAYPPAMRDMSDHTKWSPFIGKKITGAISNWPFVQYNNATSRLRYPQDLLLYYDGEPSLTISAIEIDGANVVEMTNNITVFFSLEDAKKHGICIDVAP